MCSDGSVTLSRKSIFFSEKCSADGCAELPALRHIHGERGESAPPRLIQFTDRCFNTVSLVGIGSMAP
jgi:hypothetical protein